MASKIAVAGAFAANVAIAATKFTAALLSGSSAMMSEAIHSSVDAGNQVLLFVGLSRAKRPPDDKHPYGHGKELYFWSLVVAIALFGIGGGMSVYEGILHVVHPEPNSHLGWTYAVLGSSAVFEGISFVVAIREFLPEKGSQSLLEAMRNTKDPSIPTVLAEDGAALAGLLIAFLGILGSDLLDAPRLDGVASILIGLLLATVAVFLAQESRGLLVGEAAHPEVLASIRRIAAADPAVVRAGEPMTMQLGPDQVLLNLDVHFRPDLGTADLVAAVDRLEHAIRHAHPDVKRIFIEAEAIRPAPRGPGA